LSGLSIDNGIALRNLAVSQSIILQSVLVNRITDEANPPLLYVWIPDELTSGNR
jgi:catabolite regulation protein CreA